MHEKSSGTLPLSSLSHIQAAPYPQKHQYFFFPFIYSYIEPCPKPNPSRPGSSVLSPHAAPCMTPRTPTQDQPTNSMTHRVLTPYTGGEEKKGAMKKHCEYHIQEKTNARIETPRNWWHRKTKSQITSKQTNKSTPDPLIAHAMPLP
ncbi:hypothetical protein K504DRAFT_19020 [Pleomassaria siparia CBS 279.74]|uniref:Uncharacterized protein n=1 Tax=Pleomassaria siparia CBS 279.74 TaxID=1314801 RepID=A0A6G1KQL5_9PLEO|nr:hypothetical protein K504DRAFT_19020 [Pleomassaria siparia CBS 279.74]